MSGPENPIAVAGHNNPPPETSFEIAEKKVADIYEECRLWLDGAKVSDQPTADGIANLLKMIRDAKKLADDHRKAEKEPFDKGGAEVQARYKPLLEKADRAAAACKEALQPWLDKLDAEQREAERKAREEAEAKRREAEAAIRAAGAANLEARAAAEDLVKEAKHAATVANIAARQTAKAGNLGRAVGLRTTLIPVIVDAVAFARYAWTEHLIEMEEFLTGLAHRLVRHGKRDLPGVEVHQERKAV